MPETGPAVMAAPTIHRHPCVRCGAPIPLEDAMCERCNPLGLRQPAASQVHGTVALGVLVFVVFLAVVARVATSGVGPFSAAVAGIAADPPGLSVTLTVTNDGTRAGVSTCRVFDPRAGDLTALTTFFQTPRIEPGRTVTFTRLVTGFGSDVRPLGVACEEP